MEGTSTTLIGKAWKTGISVRVSVVCVKCKKKRLQVTLEESD